MGAIIAGIYCVNMLLLGSFIGLGVGEIPKIEPPVEMIICDNGWQSLCAENKRHREEFFKTHTEINGEWYLTK